MAELALAGFVLSRIGDAQKHLTSIGTRISNYRKGPDAFKDLSHSVDRLAKHIAKVENILENVSSVPSTNVSVVFNDTFADVCTTLAEANATMGKSFSSAFAASGSSSRRNVIPRLRRFTRANALHDEMSALQSKIDKHSNRLLQLISMLGSAEQHAIVTSKIDDLTTELVPRVENLHISEVDNGVYSPATSTPALNHSIKLDFDAKNEEGNPTKPEAELKHSLLSSASSETVTVAAGVMRPAVGALGMAGVGKTVALQGLGHDKDILQRFCDGVHYMTFGRGATLQTAIREITKIMTLTGASVRVQAVKSATSLKEAVDYAVPWFEGKTCLYLLDDLWPAEGLPPGYLFELRQLMRGSPASRMAISTRSLCVASGAGCVVDFGPRDTLGPVSVMIFMAHATSHSKAEMSAIPQHELSASILKILSTCGGLPIALSVTGCAVKLLTHRYRSFETACDVYATQLKKRRTWLGDESNAEGARLNEGIMLSLEYLDVDFQEWKSKQSPACKHSITDLYTSLCILENQAWISVSVLSRMWGLEEEDTMHVVTKFCDMSLAMLHLQRPTFDSCEKPGIVLHDLQLDFCRQHAMENKKLSYWHAQLLNGYLQTASHPVEEQDAQLITGFKPRPWWSDTVPEDGYIYFNLSRHLSCAGQGLELAALLLEGRWMELRGKSGGILALVSDFEILDSVFLHWERSREQAPLEGDVRRQFDQILKAVQSSWGRMIKGLRAFQFQVCSRLVSVRKSSIIANIFVGSIEKCTPKPFLLPLNSFLPELDSALIMEIPVGGGCWCVACSPCGEYIAAGAGCDIVVAKSSTGEILQRLGGHEELVRCLTFARGSKNIVSGSSDKTVVVWEWESSESPVQVLEGHGDRVTGVAVNSEVGKIFSSSRDKTVRIWDMKTGAPAGVLPQSDGVNCVAVCGKGEKIAIGLDGGRVKVLDSITDVLFEDTEEHGRRISCLSFSPDGSRLAAGSWDSTVQVWNTQTWTKAGALLEGHENDVTSVSFRADGKQIASSSDDGTIRVWDVESGNCVGISSKHSEMNSVSFIGDGERLISGSRDGIVRIWDARLGAESKESTNGHTHRVYGVAISQNGLQVASASGDGTVRLWDTRTGKQIGKPMEGHTDDVNCVSFSPDGRRVVSGSDNWTLRLWDTETQTQVGDPFEGHAEWVHSVSFSCDGLRIISGSGDETVRIWNAETQEQIGEALEGHESYVDCVSESADGCHIVSRDCHGKVIIWNGENRSIVWKSNVVESDSESDSTDDEINSGAISNSENTFENEIAEDEAERIIRSCGQQTPHLWPESFPQYTADVYCEWDAVYSNILGENTLLADLDIASWTYHAEGRVLAAGLHSGAIALCTLGTE